MVSLVDLLDVEDVTETVEIRGKPITCRGLTAHDIATLMLGSDDVRAMMAERMLDIDVLLGMAPKAVVTVIAMGTSPVEELNISGHLKMARRLYGHEQVSLLGPIMRLTSPDGIVPLIESAAALAGYKVVVRPPAPTTSETSSTDQPNGDEPGRDQDGKLPSRSSDSLQPATQSETSGDILPDSSASSASSSIDVPSKIAQAA
jgi:hypothetical protein